MGGPRDRTPPKLLKATPLNSTRNFTAKIIQLDFDEYFKLNNVYQEITISPDVNKQPEYSIKNKSLIIKLKDTLQKNTTYVFNFGKAIADVNEGNVLKNFTYVLSTGATIDSLKITGSVTNVQTQKKEKDVTVMLFPLNRDTTWGKHKPAIYTTTDSAGNFSLANLKAGDYKVYALMEKSPNKIYDNDEELVAFKKDVIHLTRDTANLQLILFKQIPPKLRLIERKIDNDGKLYFIFNKPLLNPGVHIWDKKLDSAKIVDFSPTADTAMIYLKDMTFDSVKVSFLDKDKPLDTVTLKRSKRDTYKRIIALQYNTTFDKLKPGTDLVITSNYPIATIDPTRIIMQEDSNEVTDFNIIRDPQSLKKFTLKTRLRQGKNYSLAFNIGTFTDIYSDRSALIKKQFSVDKQENYSQLTLHVTLPDSSGNKNYVVQLLNDNNIEIKSTVVNKNGPIVFSRYPVGKYRVRVIYDANKNGKWDTGDIKQKIQPENIWIFTKTIPLRTNFEIDEDIVVPPEVPNP
ncbi:Ig-like domain-containing protein [Mucilaginibacter sp. PPCGB 2223]|uniref:Ig-like domain-containing protein n=1 Tax=Mucilaginibacter sp. PPCGB 2223 TaxID=1886027 RepID=UPI0015866AEA|nr:Ig-like domain-containing protein [Mucilaginibacter sp. PPCGB 2223]